MSNLFDRLMDKSAPSPHRLGTFLAPNPVVAKSLKVPDFGLEVDEDIGPSGLEYPVRPLEAIRQVETHFHHTETAAASHQTPLLTVPIAANPLPSASPSYPSHQASETHHVDREQQKQNLLEQAAHTPSKTAPVGELIPMLKAMPKPQKFQAQTVKEQNRLPKLTAYKDAETAPHRTAQDQMTARSAPEVKSPARRPLQQSATPQLKINIGQISVTAPQPPTIAAAPAIISHAPKVSQHNLKDYLGWKRR